MDVCGIARRAMPTRTAKLCGPGAPRLALSSRGDDPCERRRQQRLVSEESAEETVNTTAQGMPDYRAEPVVTCLCASSIRTQGCGRSWRPAFPAPSSIGGHDNAELGRNRAARLRSRVSTAVVAHPSRRGLVALLGVRS